MIEKENINETQEEKTEQVVEETPVQEEQVEEQVQEAKQENELETAITINKPDPDGKPYYEVVEEERNKILATSKKGNILSTISIVLVMGLSIAGIFLLRVNAIISYVLLGLAVVTLITFGIINHRVARPDINGYVTKASTVINEFVFADNRFSDVKYDPKDKIELSETSTDGAFSNIVRIASRNVVEGKFDNHSFKICECALFYPPQGRKQVPAFIGKYLVFPNDLHFEGRIVLVFKGEKDEDLPNGIDDLKQIVNEDKFFAYGPDDNSLKELDKKFIAELKKVDVSGHLLNLTVIVWSGKTIVYASYDDPTITLPFYEKYNQETAESFKRDLHKIFDALLVLVDKK